MSSPAIKFPIARGQIHIASHKFCVTIRQAKNSTPKKVFFEVTATQSNRKHACTIYGRHRIDIPVIMLSTKSVLVCSKLSFCNLFQVYMPMFLTDTLLLSKEYIAIIPLLTYVCSFVAALITKPISLYVKKEVSDAGLDP